MLCPLLYIYREVLSCAQVVGLHYARAECVYVYVRVWWYTYLQRLFVSDGAPVCNVHIFCFDCSGVCGHVHMLCCDCLHCKFSAFSIVTLVPMCITILMQCTHFLCI